MSTAEQGILFSKPWFSRTVGSARDASKDEALIASLPASSPVNPIQRQSNAFVLITISFKKIKKTLVKTSAYTGIDQEIIFKKN